MILNILFFCLFSTAAQAADIIESVAAPQDETAVFGEAAQPDGKFDAALIEQPQNSPNPLGNPIYVAPSSSPQIFAPQPTKTFPPQPLSQPNSIDEISPQNPIIGQISPQAVDSEIQNKLYQSGNRIYDLQSYPANDINYINQNNQNNAITNYPAY